MALAKLRVGRKKREFSPIPEQMLSTLNTLSISALMIWDKLAKVFSILLNLMGTSNLAVLAWVTAASKLMKRHTP